MQSKAQEKPSSGERNNVVPLKRNVSDKQISEALAVSSRTADKHQSELQTAYHRYVANGWKPILIYRGKKNPVGNDWINQPERPVDDFTGHHNIGIALGSRSNGLADIDIDDAELLEAAPVFLPKTEAKFGRYYGKETQSLAHWLYRAPAEKSYKLTYHGQTLIEVRSTGGQTVFPPSFVYDKDLSELDLVCWDGGPKATAPDIESLAEVSFEYLVSCVNLLAASVKTARHFKKSGFHDGMFSWAGMLAKAGYSEEDTLKSTLWIAEQSGQEDLKDREQGVRDTHKKVLSGEYDPSKQDDRSIIGIKWFRENLQDEKLVEWLSKVFKIKSVIEDDGRPVVRIVVSKETQLFDDTLRAMVTTKKFYNMAGQIVVINKEIHEIHPTSGEITFTARMTPLADSVGMGSWLTREVLFVQSTLDKVAMQYIDQVVKAPSAVASELANITTYRGDMPQIAGISNIPTITRSGRVIDDAWGYDKELKLFFSSRFQVKRVFFDEAVRILMEPFVDFPFSGGVGDSAENCCRYRAAAISSLLAAVVRPAIDICPMYVITSSQYSDGKSVMSNAIAAAVGMEGGSPNSPLTRGGSDEEQEKQISSVLARGKRVIVYDNHDGEFRSAALTETLTSSMPEFRILGKSEVRSVPNRSMFILNGVNTVLASDLQTRSVIVRLERRDLNTHRYFKHADVVGWCQDNSEKLVSAAISLIEWAISQEDGEWLPNHRFKAWDHLVRRTVRLAFGVDISPPIMEDGDRAMDPVEEIKNQLLPWVLSRWESGCRAPGKKGYFRAKDMGSEIVPDSDEEGWVNVLSRRPNYPMEQKIGKCLGALCGVPFESGGNVHVLKRGNRDGVSGYWLEVI